jgi:hypothetical protein
MLRSVWLLACMTPGDTAVPSAAGIENVSAQILQTTSSDKAREGYHVHDSVCMTRKSVDSTYLSR